MSTDPHHRASSGSSSLHADSGVPLTVYSALSSERNKSSTPHHQQQQQHASPISPTQSASSPYPAQQQQHQQQQQHPSSRVLHPSAQFRPITSSSSSASVSRGTPPSSSSAGPAGITHQQHHGVGSVTSTYQRERTPPDDEAHPSAPPNSSSNSHSTNTMLHVTPTSRSDLASHRVALSLGGGGGGAAAAGSRTAGAGGGGLPAGPPSSSALHRSTAGAGGAQQHHRDVNQANYDDIDVFGPMPRSNNNSNATTTNPRQQQQRGAGGVVLPSSSSQQTAHLNQYQHQPTVGELEFENNQQRFNSNNTPAAAAAATTTNTASATANNNQNAASIDDPVFIRECVFAMLACDKLQFSDWDARAQQYTPMGEDSGATPRQRDIYDRFALRLGTLRRRIQLLLSGPSSSFLQQSLRRAVERQLVSYSRFVSSLRCNSGDSSSSSFSTGNSTSNNTSSSVRKLGDVQVACLRAMPKLSALYNVLQKSESTKGGELVSKLGALNHHGGEELSKLLQCVYRETVTPLLYMTLQWLTKGTCSDPYTEFFVASNNAVPESSDRYWSERFSLQRSMLPSTFTAEQAEGILLAGKNINFLQKCCRVRDWRMKQSVLDAAQESEASFESIDRIIRASVADTNASVLKVLNEKYMLIQAFQRARLIYLLANGDFTSVVMERLDPHLSFPANLVSTTAVQDALQAAVASMSSTLPACMESAAPHIVAEINIPASSSSSSSASTANTQQDAANKTSEQQQQQNSLYTGWDVFSMALPFPPPYNTFFTSETLRVYRRLFRLLWKVKRAEVELKKAWQLFTHADRKFTNDTSNNSKRQVNNATQKNSKNNKKPVAKNSKKKAATKKKNADNDDDDDANNNNSSDGGYDSSDSANNRRGPIDPHNLQQDNVATGDDPEQVQQQIDATRRLRQLNAMAFKHLTHFVTNFQMYLVTEVIEVAWQKLTSDLAKCTSVDDIIDVHSIYLNNMLKYALLRDTTAPVSSLLNRMLNVALEFCSSYRNIVLATFGPQAQQAQGTTANSGGASSQQTSSTATAPSVNAASIRCQRSITTIENGICELIAMLEEDGAHGGQKLEFLQSLGSRLNFNHFYSLAGGGAVDSRSGSATSSVVRQGGGRAPF